MAISQVCEHGFEQNVLTLWWAIFLSVFPQKWNIVVSLFFLKITKMWSKVPRFFEQDFETFWCKCALLGRQSVTPDGKRRTGCIETSLVSAPLGARCVAQVTLGPLSYGATRAASGVTREVSKRGRRAIVSLLWNEHQDAYLIKTNSLPPAENF